MVSTYNGLETQRVQNRDAFKAFCSGPSLWLCGASGWAVLDYSLTDKTWIWLRGREGGSSLPGPCPPVPFQRWYPALDALCLELRGLGAHS